MLTRYQYTNAVLSLLKCLTAKYAYVYVLCFLSAVADRLGLESDASPLALYFDLYLLYEAMHTINPKHKVPDRIIAINYRISPSAKGPDIRQEIEGYMGQTGGQKGEHFPEIRRKLGKDIQALQEFTMISDG